jgi:hypothetical protein
MKPSVGWAFIALLVFTPYISLAAESESDESGEYDVYRIVDALWDHDQQDVVYGIAWAAPWYNTQGGFTWEFGNDADAYGTSQPFVDFWLKMHTGEFTYSTFFY